YIRWFAPYQFADGKIPCCVDSRGADPVAEHDSHGEFIYLVAEYVRLTGDRSLACEMWPHVFAAATYIDRLREGVVHRESGTGSDSASISDTRPPTPDTPFAGILPPSISHEGYSAKPMHSYWDDFFALRGFADAAWIATALGDRAAAARWSRVHAEFGRDLHASILAAMIRHHVDYVPGCADLGDFDP